MLGSYQPYLPLYVSIVQGDKFWWWKELLNGPPDKVISVLATFVSFIAVALVWVPMGLHYVGEAETAKTMKMIDDRFTRSEERMCLHMEHMDRSIKEFEGRITASMQLLLQSWWIGAPAGVFSSLAMGFVIVVFTRRKK